MATILAGMQDSLLVLRSTKAGLEEVIGWVSKGKIKPVIDTILPFSNMVQGHVKMADSLLFGKILTTPQKL